MPSRRNVPLAREPRRNPDGRLAAVNARVLDPASAPTVAGVSGRPTQYVGTRLMVAKGRRFDEQVPLLQQVASGLGWVVSLNREPAWARTLAVGVRTVEITAGPDPIDRAPDAWYLLQRARLEVSDLTRLTGVGLDHVVDTRPLRPAPFDVPHPDGSAGVSAGLESYGAAGSGGRQPIAYVGPKPSRFADSEVEGRRPVVAILDTGCAPHFWFEGGVVDTGVKLDRHAIGITGSATDPELHGDLTGPFDGSVDRIAGHGTFIAGLVHQACPDAQILSWRGIPATEPMIESTWLNTLAQIAELARRHRNGEAGGHPIDVLSLSMGYYHENEADEMIDPILLTVLDELSRNGVVVVASAGNDATSRPSYPAAFAPWTDDRGPVPARRHVVPIVSVGALNPNRTDALFTNGGPWVRCYAPGASVMSTMPPFQGGLQPVARVPVDGRLRESIDPDDFRGGVGRAHRGGFGLWSGTSFAAPTVAGAIAALMSRDLMSRANPDDSVRAAVTRGWRAVEHITSMKRPQ